MAKRTTPNENEYLKLAEQFNKRLLRLANAGEDVSQIKLPKKPDTFTQKTIKELQTVEPKIKRAEEEHHAKVMRGKKANYDTKSARYRQRKQKIRSHRGNPKGNPQNLQHKGNPNGNPQNLQHKGNPANLQHKGRPKGTKNKQPYSRKPISQIPQSSQTIAMSDEIMYNELKNRILVASTYTHSTILVDFFGALEKTYGRHGLLEIIKKAEEKGVVLTDAILYDSDPTKQWDYITSVIEVMDEHDYHEFDNYLYNMPDTNIDDFTEITDPDEIAEIDEIWNK